MPMTRLAVKCMSYPLPDYAIAAAINVSKSKFSNWTLGRCPLPGRAVLRLCVLFNCNAEELMGWADDIPCIEDGVTTE